MTRTSLAEATSRGALPFHCPRCKRHFATGQVADVRIVRHPTGRTDLVFTHSGTCRRRMRWTPRGRQLGFALCLLSVVLVLGSIAALVWLVTQ